MKYDFEDKLVVVTASSQGIGFGIAKGFFDAGARVAVCAREAKRLDKAVEPLRTIDAKRVFSMALDLEEARSIDHFLMSVQKHFQDTVDILVTNSGGPKVSDVLNLADSEWEAAMSSVFYSVVRLCRGTVPGMKQKGWGRIVNLTSTTAKEPASGMALSNCTRAAVAAYSKTLANEVGQFGITVNAILTGGVATERFTSLVDKAIAGTEETREEAILRLSSSQPLEFFATPEEFSKTVLFLCSSDSGYTTGTAIPVDGGASRSVF